MHHWLSDVIFYAAAFLGFYACNLIAKRGGEEKYFRRGMLLNYLAIFVWTVLIFNG